MLRVVNSDKIAPIKNKDVWNKGSGNQWIKRPQAATTTTTTTINSSKTKCKASPQA